MSVNELSRVTAERPAIEPATSRALTSLIQYLLRHYVTHTHNTHYQKHIPVVKFSINHREFLRLKRQQMNYSR